MGIDTYKNQTSDGIFETLCNDVDAYVDASLHSQDDGGPFSGTTTRFHQVSNHHVTDRLDEMLQYGDGG